jgi:predicted GIY-YIG superfamily endonuclease
MYYVYVLRVKKSGRCYIEQIQNLVKRLEKYLRGKTKSMKNRGLFDVVYVEKCSSPAEAMRREKEIKRYKGVRSQKRNSGAYAFIRITLDVSFNQRGRRCEWKIY